MKFIVWFQYYCQKCDACINCSTADFVKRLFMCWDINGYSNVQIFDKNSTYNKIAVYCKFADIIIIRYLLYNVLYVFSFLCFLTRYFFQWADVDAKNETCKGITQGSLYIAYNHCAVFVIFSSVIWLCQVLCVSLDPSEIAETLGFSFEASSTHCELHQSGFVHHLLNSIRITAL